MALQISSTVKGDISQVSSAEGPCYCTPRPQAWGGEPGTHQATQTACGEPGGTAALSAAASQSAPCGWRSASCPQSLCAVDRRGCHCHASLQVPTLQEPPHSATGTGTHSEHCSVPVTGLKLSHVGDKIRWCGLTARIHPNRACSSQGQVVVWEGLVPALGGQYRT